jgi:filamentous hemagglutinin
MALQALQAQQNAQSAARNLVLGPNVLDGLGRGGLLPAGWTGAAANVSSSYVQLGTSGSSQVTLAGGGAVTLPSGTPGNDQVSVVGAGSVTTSGGTITATAGSLTTTTGGTLATTSGGSLSVTGGSDTLAVTVPTTLSSTLAGTVTLPAKGGTVTLAANQEVTLPPGSSISFTGTSTGTVSVTGAGTVTLTGAGTLSLANSASGGSIYTNTGTASFTNGVATSLAAGSTINLTGDGTINFASGSGGAIPVIIPTSAQFTTNATVLPTTGYAVPNSGSTAWQNISAITQSTEQTTGGQTDTTVTLTQGAQQALLYWSSFNVGQNTTLDFDQSAGGANAGRWVAINQITDPSLAPSRILGSIEAPGQVYVINQNGIIFGGSSQVNVHNLTASTLAINPSYLTNGLLNDAATNPQYQFQFSSIQTSSGTPYFGNVVAGATGFESAPTGDITVEPGAQLSSPTNPEHVGGRIALIAPNVTNAGSISTPDGQTILAAGLQVGLSQHNSNDPSLRGLDVFVGAVSPDGSYSLTAGTVTNAGMGVDPVTGVTTVGDIEAARGNVTMTGETVDQLGVINSTTSAILNGRIDLLADYNAIAYNSSTGTAAPVFLFTPQQAGTVNFGSGSVTQILPEMADTDTAFGTQPSLESLINIQALSIHMLPDSLVYAPNAGVADASAPVDLVSAAIDSGVNFNAGNWVPYTTSPYPGFANDAGQIFLDSGSIIDVSGSENVSASVAENIIPVQLLGPQLADSSLQQNGALRGQTVYVDIRDAGVYNGTSWIGSPIGDLSGYVDNVGRTVGELTTNGGSVSLTAGNAVVTAATSSINVSGGWINYQGANVKTTEVMSNGQILNINQATPDRVYSGIYNGIAVGSSKWGTSNTYTTPQASGTQYDPGYVQGGNGGSIKITAPQMALDGNFYGNTVAGSLQRTPQAQLTAARSTTLLIHGVPLTSSLTLSFSNQEVEGSGSSINIVTVPAIAAPNITFEPDSYIDNTSVYNPSFVPPPPLTGPVSLATLPLDRLTNMVLSEDIVNTDGFGNLTLDISAGGSFGTVQAGTNLSIPEGSWLALPNGGNVTLTATSGGASNALFYVNSDGAVTSYTEVAGASQVLSNLPAGTTILCQNDGTFSGLSNPGIFETAIFDSKSFPGTVSGGTLTIPADSEPGHPALSAPSGASLSFSAANIDIAGDIVAPGGTLNLSAPDLSALASVYFKSSLTGPLSGDKAGPAPAPDSGRGNFTLEAGVSLSTAGEIIDDRSSSPTANMLPLVTKGGTISITGFNVSLGQGSSLDVSGGVEDSASGSLSYGNAGSLNISLAQAYNSFGQLFLGATLSGYSGNVGGGGSLTLLSPLVEIGGNLPDGQTNLTQEAASAYGDGTTLFLQQNGNSGFFSQGGFKNFDVEGLGSPVLFTSGPMQGQDAYDTNNNYLFNPAILILSGTNIDPLVISSQAVVTDRGLNLSPLTLAQTQSVLPSQRSPVNLAFNALGIKSSLPTTLDGHINGAADNMGLGSTPINGLVVRGDIVVEQGATIETDPQTNIQNGVSLGALNGTISELGSIIAPGGTISITGGDVFNGADPQNHNLLFSSIAGPLPTVDLGPDSFLSTKGVTEQIFNSARILTGIVLPGGDINITGNIVAEGAVGTPGTSGYQPGAILDVSGNSGLLYELPNATGATTQTLARLGNSLTQVDSNAGTITFSVDQELYSDATLIGLAGGPSARGGTLSISSGAFEPYSVNPPSTSPPIENLIITQNGPIIPAGYNTATVTGTAVVEGSNPVPYTVNGSSVFFAVDPNLFSNTAVGSNNGGQAGGFGSLVLNGDVEFYSPAGSSSPSINIDAANELFVGYIPLSVPTGAPTSATIQVDGNTNVTLTAPYISLGASFQGPTAPSTAGGSASTGTGAANLGVLNVDSTILTDVGTFATPGIGTLNFNGSTDSGVFHPNASAGDIRGDGVLDVAGDINLNAAQIYPPTETTFTIEADGTNGNAGSILITSPTGSLPAVPLSAGGTLNLFAANITQDGVLRAPLGTINLGNSDGSSQIINLGSTSITSVSADGMTLPYGLVNAAGDWIDPAGIDLTNTPGDLPAKAINIKGVNVTDAPNALIDVQGGGKLYAYQFTAGSGGNVDTLASSGSFQSPSSSSFAILPSSDYNYAPMGQYASLGVTPSDSTANLITNGAVDYGYYNASLLVGEQVYLNAGSGVPAGIYTLLPARYALLPGAFLVTPKSSVAAGSAEVAPDGSSFVSGYFTSSLNPTTSPVLTSFEVDSQAVVLARAPYTGNSASTFFAAQAVATSTTVPRLPIDAGQVVYSASGSLSLLGTLDGQAGVEGTIEGLGSLVDISSSVPIYIGNSVSEAPPGALFLESASLTSSGAANLLIGGFYSAPGVIAPTTSSIEVNNYQANESSGAATTLSGSDIILVSTGSLQVDAGSDINAGALTLGATPPTAQAITVSGAGTVLRVSSDPSASITRLSPTAGTAQLTIESNATTPTLIEGATLQGAPTGTVSNLGSVTLDSSSATSLDPTAVLGASTLNLNSGQITLDLTAPSTAPTTTGLVLSSSALSHLQSSISSLSLLSYSSIDIFSVGDSVVGAAPDASGNYQVTNLTLHAAEIRSTGSGNVTFNAKNVSLDNLSNGQVPTVLVPSLSTSSSSNTNSLTFDAQTINLGSGALQIAQFNTVNLDASNAVILKGLGTETSSQTNPDPIPTASTLTISGNTINGTTVLADLNISTPLITAAVTADQPITSSTTSNIDEAIVATGDISFQGPAVAATAKEGLGASLTVTGNSITDTGGSLVLPSGTVSFIANGAASPTSGPAISIGGTINVGGVLDPFYNLNKYTNGGQVTLNSTSGNVAVTSTGVINASAASGTGTVDSVPGNGGNVTVDSDQFTLAGMIEGQGSTVTLPGSSGTAVGAGGTFTLNASTLGSPGNPSLLSFIEASSNGESGLSGFTGAQNIRIRTGDVTVDGTTTTQNFNLSADGGSIDVTGSVQSLGVTGGSIDLAAGGSVLLEGTGILSVAAQQLNNAGQGGTITLQAGSYEGSIPASSKANIDLQDGAQLNLSVANTASNPSVTGGILTLSAPQVAGTSVGGYVDNASYTPASSLAAPGNPTDVAIDAISNKVKIIGANSIVVEGVYVQDANQAGTVSIDGTPGNGATSFAVNYELNAQNNASAFLGQGSGANWQTIQGRLFGSSSISPSVGINLEPGEEIDNSKGSLVLNDTWDLSTWRYGATTGQTYGSGNTIYSDPGILTMRVAGNLVFAFGSTGINGGSPNANNPPVVASLTDGFDTSAAQDLATPTNGILPGTPADAPLLPIGDQSWSYNLTAGADFSAAAFSQVKAGAGSVVLGQGAPALQAVSSITTAKPALPSYYYFQTIRTGTGNISIYSGQDVQLLNNLATIYTAGTQAALLAGFDPPAVPVVAGDSHPYNGPQYSLNGGNVVISALGNIAHYAPAPVNATNVVALDINGKPLVADSSAELPTSWLYRNEDLGANGLFSDTGGVVNSTTWWVDFTNFFEGVGALGGGNVTLNAGKNVLNVDAVVPTNARQAGVDSNGNLLGPTTTPLVQLGGGDLAVTAGNNIDGGVYYVERGEGALLAENNIQTNLTRQPHERTTTNTAVPMPTTLFIGGEMADGEGSNISVSAGDNLLLGPVSNVFLMPQSAFGVNGALSSFSTYDLTDTDPTALDVTSLTGLLTLEINPASSASPTASSFLDLWYDNNFFSGGFSLQGSKNLVAAEPWLYASLYNSENKTEPLPDLMPPTLRATAFSSDLNVVGNLALAPAANGTLDLIAAHSINGVESAGTTFYSSLINLSDTSPSNIPSITNPAGDPFGLLNGDLTENPATQNVALSTELNLHGTDPDNNTLPLHSGDLNPVYLYADNGDISGITLFSPKFSQVIAGKDITDVSFYIQNTAASDISVIGAGGNIVPYDLNSVLRQDAMVSINSLPPNSGDLQISGPGTLEVLAGDNFTLLGSATGLTSIGQERNPLLPFAGADIVAAAGLGSASTGLDVGSLDFTDAKGAGFIDQFLNPSSSFSARYLPDLADAMGLGNALSDAQIWDIFSNIPDSSLTPQEKALQAALTPGNRDSLALTVFYEVLRDAGRDHNALGTNYNAGYAAIAALLPSGNSYQGNIDLTSSEIKTTSDSNISLFAPGGQITVGVNSSQAVDVTNLGIFTQDGGNISIFAKDNVNVGTSRIFTLHGGNEIIWSTLGNIAAGSSSKTVLSAPPTRVLVDSISGDVELDLAGLATGGGIGVLESVVGAPPGDVDLIAPSGVVDAGDAGIRASGNVNIAAVQVLNAGNISFGGKSSGVPTTTTPNFGALAAASSTAGSSVAAAGNTASSQSNHTQVADNMPSLISVEVLGYGGGDDDN